MAHLRFLKTTSRLGGLGSEQPSMARLSMYFRPEGRYSLYTFSSEVGIICRNQAPPKVGTIYELVAPGLGPSQHPKAPSSFIGSTWALKGLLYPNFGL